MGRASRDARTALVATLGGKPQVATLALDALLATGAHIERVAVVHLSPSDPRIQRSLDLLRHEFEHHRAYTHRRRIHFDPVTVRDKPGAILTTLHASASGRAIERVDDFAAADAMWLTMHRLITALKAEGYRIDLCVTGGPRLIGLQALSAASLLFAPHDRCWHLYTPEDVRVQAGEGAIMHASKHSGIRLVAVPLLPLGMIAPNLQAAASATPEQIIGERRQVLTAQELKRCEDVLRRLTPRQRQVVQAFARQGATVDGVARAFHVTEATLNTHKTRIFEECRIAWSLPAGEKLTHYFLREAFGGLSAEVWRRWV